MIHHVYAPRTILACALLALVATVSPANAAANGDNFTAPITSDASFQAPAALEVIAPTSTPASIADLAATGETFQAAAMPAAITPAAATVTTNGLLSFTSQTEFQTAFPGLPKEDFEESTVANGAITLFPTPLDSSTNVASAFAPGNILPGLTIQNLNISPTPSQAMFVEGVGYHNANTSKIVGMTFSGQVLSIEFSDTVNAVGMDLLLWLGGGGTTVSIYGASGLIDTLTPTIGTTVTFLGIYSSEPITQITVSAPGDYEMVDNIQFGAIPTNLTFYTGQSAFTTVHPGLPVEDFEESGIADNSFFRFQSPLDSTSNVPPAFVPGDIVSGLRIGLTVTSAPIDMGVLGGSAGFGNTSKVVYSAQEPSDGLAIAFPNYSAYAVGMDLMHFFSPGNTVIAVYGPHGILLGSTVKALQTTATFFGVYSNQPITRIEVLNNSEYEMVDNIRFGGSPAGLTFYNSQASFLTAKPGLPVEDFEESPVAPNTVAACTQPINSATNVAGCFAPGDILPGITFQPQAPCSINCDMGVLGAGYFFSTSKQIGPYQCVNDLEISFVKKNVRYFGTDIRSFIVPADYLLSFYDEHGNFIGSALRNIGTTPIFLGAVSQKHLSKVIVTDSSFGSCEVVDNVRFGAFSWETIIPAISGH